MHTIVAATLAVGDVIYARGSEREVVAISYSDPEAGLITVKFADGEEIPVGASKKVSAVRLTRQ